MTTIRAHVPVEAPAGLLVALPPLLPHPSDGEMVPAADEYDIGAVFDLAVPCPTCDGVGVILGAQPPPLDCECDDGWVLHGRYRALDVLPITNGDHDADFIQIGSDGAAWLHRMRQPTGIGRGWISTRLGNLPAAVPGGIALIVEAVA
jgi:hypothetical protein